MALNTPTVTSINAAIIAQLEADLSQKIPLLPKSFLRVLSKALAAVFVLLYKYAGWISLQMFVSTASADEVEIGGRKLRPLVEWGRLIGVGDPAAATAAELTIDVTVTTQGETLPSGTPLVSSANGVTYLTTGAVLLDAATKSVTIRAAADQTGGGGAGAIGNLDAGAIVSFVNPLGYVSRDAEVTAQTVTGADGEEIEGAGGYRQRVIDRFRKRLQGGAYADYEAWGKEPAGIVAVYPYTSVYPGQVDVYVEATPESSGDPDGIPTSAQLLEVKASIEYDNDGLASRKPAGPLVNVLPITRRAFDVEVVDLEVDDEATVQADIETAIGEYFANREPYILGLTIPPRRDRISPAELSGKVSDVVNAAGGVFGSLVISMGGAPVVAYSLAEGEKAKAGTVTFS